MRDRVAHMLDAAREAIAFAQGRSRADLEHDRLLVLGLTKLIEIIGEAASGVPRSTRSTYPTIEWEDIIGMRHHLIHVYHDVNLDILWNTIRDDLPPLILRLESILAQMDADASNDTPPPTL